MFILITNCFYFKFLRPCVYNGIKDVALCGIFFLNFFLIQGMIIKITLAVFFTQRYAASTDHASLCTCCTTNDLIQLVHFLHTHAVVGGFMYVLEHAVHDLSAKLHFVQNKHFRHSGTPHTTQGWEVSMWSQCNFLQRSHASAHCVQTYCRSLDPLHEHWIIHWTWHTRVQSIHVATSSHSRHCIAMVELLEQPWSSSSWSSPWSRWVGVQHMVITLCARHVLHTLRFTVSSSLKSASSFSEVPLLTSSSGSRSIP